MLFHVKIYKLSELESQGKSILLLRDGLSTTSYPRVNLVYLGRLSDEEQKKKIWDHYSSKIVTWNEFVSLHEAIVSTSNWMVLNYSKSAKDISSHIYWSSFDPFGRRMNE